MDNIINKFIKQLPLGIVVGCFMIEYKVMSSIFYPGFDDANIESIKTVFKNFTYSRITEGTIISSKSKIPLNNGSYDMEKISDFLEYPCSINSNRSSYKIGINLTYDDLSDTLLIIYCKQLDNNAKMFSRDIVKFIKKLDSKLSGNLNSYVTITKYFTVKQLRDIVDLNGKLNDDSKVCIEDLFKEYGYGLILNLHINKKINMYSKKCKTLLSLLLRLCELEIDKKFNPNDKAVKSNTIIDKLKEFDIYTVKKQDKYSAIVNYPNIIF
jgi:hypothetical protein